MFVKFIKPSGILSKYIRYYCVLEIGSSAGEVCERVIPTGDIQLMFHYGNTFVCKNPGNPRFCSILYTPKPAAS